MGGEGRRRGGGIKGEGEGGGGEVYNDAVGITSIS